MLKKILIWVIGGFVVLVGIGSMLPDVPVEDQVQEVSAIPTTTDVVPEKPAESTNQPETVKAVESKPTPAPQTVPVSAPQYTYYSVTDVVDGDTVKVNINGTVTTLRLIGMDTPETVDPRKPVQCFGKEASNKAKELLSGKKVRLEMDPSQGTLDTYGRTLAYIYREDGLFFNKYMIEQGYAHEYTYRTPYKYQAEFKTAQKRAQTNQVGLWSPSTCNGDTTSSSETVPATTSSGGKFYTSSHYSAKYYYPEACNGWESLSPTYLKSFDTLEALLASYPSRTKSPQCQ